MKYFPASSFAILHLTKKESHKILEHYGKSCNWWEENSFFRHPHMLISAYHGREHPNFREKFKIPNKNFILEGDSGGFSQYGGSLQLDPIEILDWQERNCDIGFSLDFPLVVKDNATDVKIKNKHTIKNADIAIKNRKNYDMDFYMCTHAWNEKQRLEFQKQLSLNEIQGWGIGECSATDDSPEGIISRVALEVSLNENKLPMHILGCCNGLMIAFLALVEKKEGIEMFYDSTAYSNGAMYRWYHLDGFKKKKLKLNAEFKDNVLPCDCPVCKEAKIEDMKVADSEAGTLISLHNLWHEIELDKKIFELSSNPSKLFDFLAESYGSKILASFDWLSDDRKFAVDKRYRNVFKMIELYLDKPIEEFIQLYPYNNKFNSTKNIEVETALSESRHELKLAKERLQKDSKKKKPKKKAEVKEKSMDWKIKDGDWNL